MAFVSLGFSAMNNLILKLQFYNIIYPSIIKKIEPKKNK